MRDRIAVIKESRNVLIQDQQRAVAILLLVYQKYSLHMDQKTTVDIGWLLHLPKLSKKEFSSYWDAFLQPLQKEWYDLGLKG